AVCRQHDAQGGELVALPRVGGVPAPDVVATASGAVESRLRAPMFVPSRTETSTIIEGHREARRGKVLTRSYDEETVRFIRRFCLSYLHPEGACPMGPEREAVVDAELRVRGVEGVRVADASVMPTSPSTKTNAPSIMIGEFASRLLAAGRVGAFTIS